MTDRAPAPPLVLTELRQTCDACPSQWEGTTDDGRPVYIRFRHGWLSVRLGLKGGDIDSAVRGEEILYMEHGGIGEYYDFAGDGVMTTEGMAGLVRDVLTIPPSLLTE